MSTHIDLTGRTFFLLDVLHIVDASPHLPGKNKGWYYMCKCACGTKKKVRSDHLTSGNTKSCGCYKTAVLAVRGHNTHIDITGNKYGRLTAIARNYEYFRDDGKAYWTCKCDCGAVATRQGRELRRGTVKSCGCLRREIASLRMRAKRDSS